MLAIDRARPDEWRPAFDLAYRRLPGEARRLHVERALDLVAAGTLNPAGVWIAREHAAVVGVQVCVPLGGASFLFWLPEACGSTTLEDALVRAALADCRAQAGKVTQAIVAPEDASRAAPLLRHGFAKVTQLLYLEHDLHCIPAESHDLHCEPFGEANRLKFRDTLARTYEGTLDCPELNGARTVDEILTAYRDAGSFRPERWWLIRNGDAPAGVVILTELPEDGAWDLSYIGVVPEKRRRGLARRAACRALHAARAASALQVLLAVDVRNAPARRLYESLGFRQAETRDVYLLLLANAAGISVNAATSCPPCQPHRADPPVF
jgi:ribosomal protein S18 acetylase RimI-like enzyme